MRTEYSFSKMKGRKNPFVKRFPYSVKEWSTIERLASEKGKSFSGAQAAKSYLKDPKE